MDAALKILAVDDNRAIRSSMHFIFASPRYEVTDVESGKSALATLASSGASYDVIILDQKMPRLTGLELLQEIRKRGFPGKVIVLSAHLTPEIKDAYRQMDVDVILDKPFDIHQLRSALDQLAA